MEEEKDNFDRLLSIMNRAYGCFLLWKQIRVSASIPDSGKEEAERRMGIVNRYDGLFSVILYATENTFIGDLHKLFDERPNALKLETLIAALPQEEQILVRELRASIEQEVKHLRVLRQNYVGHEPIKGRSEKIYTNEIEHIFTTVEKMLNVISKNIGKPSFIWNEWEGNTASAFEKLLSDLDNDYNK